MSWAEDADWGAYRDAVGLVLAARRGDTDAIRWFLAFQPALRGDGTDALVALSRALMREIDSLGGDADAIVSRWARALASRADDQTGAAGSA